MADEQLPENDFVYLRMSGDTSNAPPGRATRAAYEQIWKAKGFVIVDETEAALLLSPEAQAELATESTTKKKG